jgi:hypothetical protein
MGKRMRPTTALKLVARDRNRGRQKRRGAPRLRAQWPVFSRQNISTWPTGALLNQIYYARGWLGR